MNVKFSNTNVFSHTNSHSKLNSKSDLDSNSNSKGARGRVVNSCIFLSLVFFPLSCFSSESVSASPAESVGGTLSGQWPFFEETTQERGLEAKEMVLRGADNSRIYLSYGIENRAPNVMGGTTKFVTGLKVQVGGKWAVSHSGRERIQSVRAVLVNTCKAVWMDKPNVTTYVVDLEAVDRSQLSSGTFALNGTAIANDESPVYGAEFEDFEGFSTGYRYDTECTQELSVVHDGSWLKDPVSQSHNFKFAFIHLKDNADPLAAWVNAQSGIELISAGAWQRYQGVFGMRAMLRVRNHNYNKTVGVAYEKAVGRSEDGALIKEWAEQYASYVGPLSDDTELWEVEIADQLSLEFGTQFAVFYKKPGREFWDTNCGSNYLIPAFDGLEPEEVVIRGRGVPCNR